jgi:hypothetical protein
VGRWLRKRRAEVPTMTHREPIRIADLLREAPGKWVALKGHRLVDVAETPDALHVRLKERGIRGATIMRSPGEHEPLQIGLG